MPSMIIWEMFLMVRSVGVEEDHQRYRQHGGLSISDASSINRDGVINYIIALTSLYYHIVTDINILIMHRFQEHGAFVTMKQRKHEPINQWTDKPTNQKNNNQIKHAWMLTVLTWGICRNRSLWSSSTRGWCWFFRWVTRTSRRDTSTKKIYLKYKKCENVRIVQM